MPPGMWQLSVVATGHEPVAPEGAASTRRWLPRPDRRRRDVGADWGKLLKTPLDNRYGLCNIRSMRQVHAFAALILSLRGDGDPGIAAGVPPRPRLPWESGRSTCSVNHLNRLRLPTAWESIFLWEAHSFARASGTRGRDPLRRRSEGEVTVDARNALALLEGRKVTRDPIHRGRCSTSLLPLGQRRRGAPRSTRSTTRPRSRP